MSRDGILEALSEIPALSSLSTTRLERLAQECVLVQCTTGQMVINHLDYGRDVYFVVEGALVALLVSDVGKQFALTDIGSGACFGELAAILDRPRSASVIAVEPSKLLQISGDRFLQLLGSEPQVAFALIQKLAAQVAHLTSRCFSLATHPVETRLRIGIVLHAMSAGVLYDGGQLRPAPTHEQLASEVASDRPVVSRALAEMVAEGAIRTGRRVIEILDVERLLKGLSLAQIDLVEGAQGARSSR